VTRDAIVAVVERGGRYLFVRRAPGRPAAGYWTPVTGRLESGESPAAAVAREAREEVGVEVRPGREVWRSPAEGADFRLLWWTATLVAGEPFVACDEIDAVAWVDAAGLDALAPVFETTRRYFREIHRLER
jgi:8-oxo-dGTP pyrophosphatase MutT (NUDIX family)